MAKRKFGDRPDGRRLRDIPAMMQCCADLKPRRGDNIVYINQKMDVTELADYLAKKKEEGENITFFHAFLTAFGKVIYNRPKLNRFVSNRHFYEHNDVTFAYVAKVGFSDKSSELMAVTKVDPEDNVFTIRDQVLNQVDAFRKKKEAEVDKDKKGANSALEILGKLPNIIRVPIFGLIKLMGDKGILPASLRKDNIYFSTMIVSNLGAIHCGSIMHNLAQFGSSSGLATMGEVKSEMVTNPDGTQSLRKLCEFGINLDERIGDGYYFAKSVQMIQYILSHPEMLEERADTVIDMGEIR